VLLLRTSGSGGAPAVSPSAEDMIAVRAMAADPMVNPWQIMQQS
jgi:hypothetical protein